VPIFRADGGATAAAYMVIIAPIIARRRRRNTLIKVPMTLHEDAGCPSDCFSKVRSLAERQVNRTPLSLSIAARKALETRRRPPT